MKNNFSSVLNKASWFQILITCLVSIICLMVYKSFYLFTGFLISGIISSLYTQLIKLGQYSKVFALFGFPIRLILTVPICAILVHKLHSNLIALFTGFVLCQIVYFVIIFSYVKKEPEIFQ